MRLGLYLALGVAAALEWALFGLLWQSEGDESAAVGRAAAETSPALPPDRLGGEALAGTIHGDIWQSAAAVGLSAKELAQLAEIFAWQLDFSRDLQPGDRWRVLLAPPSGADGKKPRPILAAELEHGEQVFRAVRFSMGKNDRYFAADGRSLQRQFLRSPLYQTRVTSAFAKHRFHPILKVSLPHLGVDYGAPFGTPVMAAGDGIGQVASYQGGSGKMVVIRHGQRYETRYKHLSRFARGLSVGRRVRMGEVIGFVGATGLATGPHLHFEFYDGPRVVNPQAIDASVVPGVPESERPAFLRTVAQVEAKLPPWSPRVEVASRRAMAAPRQPASSL